MKVELAVLGRPGLPVPNKPRGFSGRRSNTESNWHVVFYHNKQRSFLTFYVFGVWFGLAAELGANCETSLLCPRRPCIQTVNTKCSKHSQCCKILAESVSEISSHEPRDRWSLEYHKKTFADWL